MFSLRAVALALVRKSANGRTQGLNEAVPLFNAGNFFKKKKKEDQSDTFQFCRLKRRQGAGIVGFFSFLAFDERHFSLLDALDSFYELLVAVGRHWSPLVAVCVKKKFSLHFPLQPTPIASQNPIGAIHNQ